MSRARRPILIHGSVASVTLTQGYTASVDISDVPLIEGGNWSALIHPRRKAIYAARVQVINGKSTMLLMHRVLLAAPSHLQVDHKNGDGLNNRRSNLRLCTHAQNQLNKRVRSDSRSGLKGAHWSTKYNTWKAEISVNGRNKFLGNFPTPEEAHAAYVEAVKIYHGKFGAAS